MTNNPQVRVLCVDDHRIVREGIALILSREPDITVVATAATAQGILSATVFSIAMIIGPGIGSWVADRFGVPALFTLAWTTSTVAIPVLWLGTRASPSEQPVRASRVPP